MKKELEELKLEELKKFIAERIFVGTTKDGLKIMVEDCGRTKSMNGKLYINWEFIAEKDNKIIKICRTGNRIYDIKKAYAELCCNIGADHWHIIK